MGVSKDDKRSIKGHRGIRQIKTTYRQEYTMRTKLTYITPLLGAAAAAAAIVAAPIAAADTGQSCSADGSGTICQSPGNAQINDAPPPVNYYPYGGEAFLLCGVGLRVGRCSAESKGRVLGLRQALRAGCHASDGDRRL